MKPNRASIAGGLPVIAPASAHSVPSEIELRPAAEGEELAGPARPLPTLRQERIGSMDVLRGVALLGILIANVTSFGLPDWAYFAPLSINKPAFSGPHAHLNTVIWFARWVFMEGKMRGLFSLLFGAGVILLTSRAEKRGAVDKVADIFLRRNMWLLLFGVLHAYLVWAGDILYFYALTALIFLYPLRRLKPKTLLITAGCVLALNAFDTFSSGRAMLDLSLHKRAATAIAAQQAGATLTDQQKDDIQAWNERLQEWKPDQKAIDDDLAANRGGYLSAQAANARIVVFFERDLYYGLGFCDVLSMMLIGMALVKNGFLTAQRSCKTYALAALVATAISVPVVFIGASKALASNFDLITTDKWMFLTYDLGRVPGTIAIASIVLLIVKAGAPPWATKRLAAVGQMALSNYLLTSIVCKFIFVWGPWKLYGKLEYYQLYYVLLAVWVVNLVWSPIWLRYFEFGPAEWLWRSLTYWKKQPIRVWQAPGGPGSCGVNPARARKAVLERMSTLHDGEHRESADLNPGILPIS